ncbi:MAG: response regulator [Lachnospiraceae bacterium]|nr:response regulator [Lachnospiraceae bacterium]
MLFEDFLNIYSIVMTMIALLLCLDKHITHPRRAWMFAVMMALGDLLSNYYWGAYTLLMGENPNISAFMAYLGWNLAYIPFLMLILHVQSGEERKFFSPLMLLPIPLNIYQCLLYCQFGGIFNNVWQGVFCTAAACACLQSLLYYWRHRREGAKFPYVAMVSFISIAMEYGSYTASCFSWPSEALDPYNYLSALLALRYIAIAWAITKTYQEEDRQQPAAIGSERVQLVLKVSYTIVALICCAGGYWLGLWMRDILRRATFAWEEADPYRIIAVMLFIFSCVLAFISIAVIFLVDYGKKAVEGDKLREEKQIAEQANVAKSDFLANMSHEIRTPINAMLGMNEIILRESLQARDLLPRERDAIRSVFSNICKYSGDIESAGHSLLAIINDILDFSKIENGKMEIIRAPYKLSSVLNDVSNMIVFKARSKELTFQVEVDETLPDILDGDEVRIRQVITNILNNAVKYTDEGAVHLAVSSGQGERRKGERIDLVVRVKDTGIGIKKEDMDRLFNKFERVNLERNSTVEGTGLGLAITQSLLGLMDGTIDVQSVYGVGSIFTVTIPQTIVSTEPVGNFREKFEKSMQEAKARKDGFKAPDARILIVDDTRMNLIVAKGLLKNTEIKIDTATSGEEAIRLAKTNPYDLILMDQRMPGMDGTKAMQKIQAQKDGANRSTPVICLTADAVSGARERYLSQGFTNYLSKPIDSAALERMLVEYLPSEKVVIISEGGFVSYEEMVSSYEIAGRFSKKETVLSPETVTLDNFSEKKTVTSSETSGSFSENAFAGLHTNAFAGLHSNSFAELQTLGLDPETGLRYCQGDEDLYLEMLREYAQNAGEKIRDLRKHYEAQDLQNYAIIAHSVKSSSKMIGAAALSEIAAKLEKAADESRTDGFQDDHNRMLEQYAALAEAILRHVGMEDGNNGEEESDGEGEGILEFLPD